MDNFLKEGWGAKKRRLETSFCVTKGGNYPNSTVLCLLKLGITPIPPICVTKGRNYPNSDVLCILPILPLNQKLYI